MQSFAVVRGVLKSWDADSGEATRKGLALVR